MSPKIQVQFLSDLSLRAVANILTHTLSECNDHSETAVIKYLSETTIEVLQDLLALILRLENLDASTRFSCLETILRKDIPRLDTGMFPNFYYSDILRVIKQNGTGLKHLNLNGVWLRNMPEKLANTIENLKHLKVLLIPHMADDNVLYEITKLNEITVLDISGECAFTRSTLENLKSTTLSILDIGYYGKEELWQGFKESVDVMANLIKQLKNLKVLKTYSFTGKSLLKIYKENPLFKCNLRYIHDTNTSSDILDAVVTTCPFLESINFNNPEIDVVKGLGYIKRLNNVKLSRTPCIDVVEYLQSGNKVTSLSLNLLRGQNLDVSVLALSVPDLQQLKCFKTSLVCLTSDVFFLNLNSVEILYCDINDVVLKTLLVNSPFLKRVVIADEIRMTDGDIFRLCAECTFENLQELWLFAAKALTITSVELLMKHCVNLRVIGQLSGWDITIAELDYMKAVINSNNTDLTLHL